MSHCTIRRLHPAPTLLALATLVSPTPVALAGEEAESTSESRAESRAKLRSELPSGSFTERAASAAVELPELMVTGSAAPTDPWRMPAQGGGLGSTELRERNAAGLGAALEQLPGVAMLATGELASAPVLRGLSGLRVLLLADGAPQAYQQFGVRHPPLLDPALAMRVELLQGPASLLYGSDALGGVVQVFGDDPLVAALRGGWELDGGLDYSSAHQAFGRQLGLSGGEGHWGVNGRLSWRDSDGFCTPSVATAEHSDDPDAPLASGCLPYTD